MSYNPEKPQFWQPFCLSGIREIKYGRTSRITHVGAFIRDLHGFDAREIVYPEYNEEDPLSEVLEGGGFACTYHLRTLRKIHTGMAVPIPCSIESGEPLDGQRHYRHSFVWRDGDNAMVDSWLSTLDDSGYPTSTVRVFKGYDEVDASDYGHAGGNTLLVLGEEEKLRRKFMKLGKGIEEFANRSKDNMPDFEPGFIARARLQRR